MENRIDHLFKKRLGGATSSDVPANKAATLDALTKSKGGFRLWMLLPLLLLIGGTGWAVYQFQIGNETSHRHATSSQESNVSITAQVVDRNNATLSLEDKHVKPNNLETAEPNVGSTIQQTSKFPAVSNDQKNSTKSSRAFNNSAQQNRTQEDVGINDEIHTPDQGLNERFSPEAVVVDELPNDHSVEAFMYKNGSFSWELVPGQSFTPLKKPAPIWTLTARGLVGGAVPVFGNVESTGGQLRNEYETAGLSFGGELGIERTFGKWRVGSGIGAMRIQSKVDYPVLSEVGEVTIDSTIWTTFLNTYYEVDSTFNPVLSVWVYDTTYFTELDSIGVDTSWIELAQIANGSLQKANGRSSISVITIPIQLQYKLFENDRIGSLHAVGGMQWVYAYRRRGYFVTSDGEGLIGVNEDPGFKRMNVHLNVGLDWRYPLTDRLFTTVQPVLNYSILNWQSGYDQRFVTPMLKFGLGWRLK